MPSLLRRGPAVGRGSAVRAVVAIPSLCLILVAALAVGCHRKATPGVTLNGKSAGAIQKPPPVVHPPLPPTPTIAVDGPQLYQKYCALCHGDKAQGYAADNAPSLVSRTFLGTATDDFLRIGIERGLPGTAMAGDGKLVGGPLWPEEVAAIIRFVRSLPQPPVAREALVPATTLGEAARGALVYGKRCESCHGTPKQRAQALHLVNPMLLLTASNEYLRYAIDNGRPGTKMAAWKDKLSPGEIDDVIAYLRSLAPKLGPEMAVGLEPAAAPHGPIVLNPQGGEAKLALREGRFASLDSVKAALDGKERIVILDARAPSDWGRLHITGAISVPYYDLSTLDEVPKDGTWIIAYCACPHHASGVVVDELRKRGVAHSAVLDEGIFAWQQKGYPVVAAPNALPVPAPPPLRPPLAKAPPPAPGTPPVGALAPHPAARVKAPSRKKK